jgi:hypothetical protein
MREVPSFGAWLTRRRKALVLTQEALALIDRAVSGAPPYDSYVAR